MTKKKENISYSIGFDLGGTKLAAALVDSHGRIIEHSQFSLTINEVKSPQQAKKKIINLMCAVCIDYKQRYPTETSTKKFSGIGLASAGPLNVNTGELIDPSNFPGWKRFKIVKTLENSLKKIKWSPKIYFQNDAMAAAFAEKWIGDAQKCQSFVVITVGTGIGTGVLLNNSPCQTAGMGSEWGLSLVDIRGLKKNHTPVIEYTVEGIASGSGLLKRARAMGFNGNSVEELVAENSRTSKYISLYDDMAWALASLCYNLSLGFHLDKILFTGGLINIKSLYWKKTKEIYNKMIVEHNPAFLTPIAIAKTGNNAGVIGAASLPYMLKN